MRFCIRTVVIVVLSMTTAGLVAAQETGNWLQMKTIVIDPGLRSQFQQTIQRQMLPGYEEANVAFMHTWQTDVFGEANQYVFVMPIPNFAQYDGSSLLEEAMRGDAYRTMRSRLDASIREQRIQAMRWREDLSFDNLAGEPPNLALVSYITVLPGKRPEFEKLIKDQYLPAAETSKAKAFWILRTMLGGPTSEYVLVTVIDSYSEIDAGTPIMRLLGPDKSAESELAVGTLIASERTEVARYVRELSFVAGQSENEEENVDENPGTEAGSGAPLAE